MSPIAKAGTCPCPLPRAPSRGPQATQATRSRTPFKEPACPAARLGRQRATRLPMSWGPSSTSTPGQLRCRQVGPGCRPLSLGSQLALCGPRPPPTCPRQHRRPLGTTGRGAWGSGPRTPDGARRARAPGRPDPDSPEGFEAGFGDVLLVEPFQGVQEGVHLAHHDLGGLPALVFGDLAPGCGQDHDSGRDVDHGVRGGSEGLQLRQVVLQRQTDGRTRPGILPRAGAGGPGKPPAPALGPCPTAAPLCPGPGPRFVMVVLLPSPYSACPGPPVRPAGLALPWPGLFHRPFVSP